MISRSPFCFDGPMVRRSKYGNDREHAVASVEADICDEIRAARLYGSIRCGVIEGCLTIADVARAFGLSGDISIYRSIEGTEATEIAVRVLSVDLVCGLPIMDVSEASRRWQQFMEKFHGQEIRFLSNVGSFPESWTPATSATFDIGVLVIGATKSGCLWVEEED